MHRTVGGSPSLALPAAARTLVLDVMGVAATELFRFDNWFARELSGLYVDWQAATMPAPRLLALNEPLAHDLGLDPAELRTPEGVAALAGNLVPAGATPIAHGVCGAPVRRLRTAARRRSGVAARRTGRHAAVSDATCTSRAPGQPPSRRWRRQGGHRSDASRALMGEAMHALGIPTTRALAVVATGEHIAREAHVAGGGADTGRVEPPARRHVRVRGRLGDREVLRRLADHAIARHYPDVATEAMPVRRSTSRSSRPRLHSSRAGCWSGSSTAS